MYEINKAYRNYQTIFSLFGLRLVKWEATMTACCCCGNKIVIKYGIRKAEKKNLVDPRYWEKGKNRYDEVNSTNGTNDGADAAGVRLREDVLPERQMQTSDIRREPWKEESRQHL